MEERQNGVVDFRGKRAIVFERRIKRAERLEGRYYYEMRHPDEDWSEPYSIEPGVLINFWGTLVTEEELLLDEQLNGRREIHLTDKEIEMMYLNAIT